MRRIALFALALALTAGGDALARSKGPVRPACDHACLIGLADRYVDAMAAKAPARLPWAEPVRFSEDGVPMMVGDALWGSISARSSTPLRVADETAGEVAWFGVVEEHGEPSFLALRLKAVDGRIAEAETVIRRKGGPAPYGDPASYRPDPALAQLEPGPRRMSRRQLIAAADAYFDALAAGRTTGGLSRGCLRRENGAQAVACESPGRPGLGKVRARAYPIVDEVRGVVVATGLLDYPARQPQAVKYPESLAFVQAFKLTASGISRIEAIYTPVPYLMPSPWAR
jgi:hypothetical protein